MPILIRRARPAEAVPLTEIAHAAKRRWGYPESWLTRWREALTFTPEFISQYPVYVATEAGVRLGCYAFELEGPAATLEHLWVLPQHEGRGVGRQLLEHAAQQAASLGATVLEIDSDPHAEAFYLRMGAHRTGEVPADIDGHQRVLPRLELILQPA